MPQKIASGDIATANSFTGPVVFFPHRDFDIDISGTFVATVTLQRRNKDGSAWNDIKDYTEPTLQTGSFGTKKEYRIGIKSGNYTSGTAGVEISQDPH